MALLKQFHPPAFIKDLTDENAKGWSTNYISDWVTSASKRLEVSQFYNAVTSDYTEEPTPLPIFWIAFPNNVRQMVAGAHAQYELADSRRAVQDEYCEWSVERRDGKIVRAVFTCGGPEFWKALAELQPDTVVELYNKHNPGLNITKEQLFFPNSEGKLVVKAFIKPCCD